MDAWIEEKYIQLLGPRLKNFRKISSTLYNCSCPICGDSAKSQKRARGYIGQKSGRYYYYCHNCFASHRFGAFLSMQDPLLHEQMLLEAFGEKSTKSVPVIPAMPAPVFLHHGTEGAVPILDLPKDGREMAYLIGRRIPSERLSDVFLVRGYKEWVNGKIPGSFSSTDIDEDRLMFPVRNRNGVVSGYVFRALDPSEIKYVNIKASEGNPKLFGLDRLDPNRHFFVTEGPIDSMFLKNAVAACGSGLIEEVRKARLDLYRGTFVFDNEPRKIPLLKKMQQAIDANVKICIWPENITPTDINAMVLAGIEDIETIIKNNTYVGLDAQLRFNTWRKAYEQPKTRTQSRRYSG